MTPSTTKYRPSRAQFKLDEHFPGRSRARLRSSTQARMARDDGGAVQDSIFLRKGYFARRTLTCLKNNKAYDVRTRKEAAGHKIHLVIDPRYGKIRGKTFRRFDMGRTETEQTVRSVGVASTMLCRRKLKLQLQQLRICRQLKRPT